MTGRGREVRAAEVQSHEAAELAAVLDPTGSERSCHVLLLLRPWLSMRRYGERGYLYAHLDGAHAATNLAGATPSDWSPVLRTGSHLPAIAAAAEPLRPAFHEVHSVLSFEPGHRADPATVPVQTARHPAPPEPASLEALCWAHLVGPLQHSAAPPAAPIRAVPEPRGGFSTDGWRRWRGWVAERRSCRRFDGPRLDPESLVRTLSTLGIDLPVDLGETDAAGMSATLLLGPGHVVDDEIKARLAAYGTVADWPADLPTTELVRACRDQRHVEGAQAFVLLHQPEGQFVVEGRPDLLRTALFRAGHAAHLVHLGAVGARAGVLTIGRFDQGFWARAGRLAAGDRILYLLALGTEKEST